MKRTSSHLAIAALLLAGSALAPVSFAQSNDTPSQSTQDYSEDPSYQAARRLLEVFAGVANDRANEAERAEAEEELSTDPWPEPPNVGPWDHHYFIYKGENYFPILASYVTPYVTLFALQAGYTPVGEENKNCGQSNGHQTVEDNTATQVTTITERALAADQAGALANQRRFGCPKIVGELWGSGSQIMDKDHNPLAEQWFEDGTKAIISDGFPLHDEDRYDGDDPSDFLVVFSGGPDRLNDPAIHPLPVSKMVVLDYPFRRADRKDPDGPKDDGSEPKKPFIPGAPEIPIRVFGRPVIDEDDQTIAEGPYYSPIDAITARIDETLDKILAERAAAAEFLLVHRADPELPEQVVADRLRAIRETLNPHGDVNIVSFGQEMPICRTNDERCWSMNRSSILYIIDR